MSADHDRLVAPGLVSIYELMDRADVSYKTVLKHIRAGKLTGEQIGGRRQWSFTTEEVERYRLVAPKLVAKGRAASGPKTREKAPSGYLTLAQVAKRCDCSHWFVRDQIKAGRLKATKGKFGKLFVTKEDAAPFIQEALHEKPGRPYRRKPKRRRLCGEAKDERDRAIVADHLAGMHTADLSAKYRRDGIYIRKILRDNGHPGKTGQAGWRKEFRERWRAEQRLLAEKATLARWGKPANRSEDILAEFEGGMSMDQIASARNITCQAVYAAIKRARSKRTSRESKNPASPKTDGAH